MLFFLVGIGLMGIGCIGGSVLGIEGLGLNDWGIVEFFVGKIFLFEIEVSGLLLRYGELSCSFYLFLSVLYRLIVVIVI